jgi:GT2 family glycosyltransferase
MESRAGLGSALVVLVVYQRPWCHVHAGALLESALGCTDRTQDTVPQIGRLLVYDNSREAIGRPTTNSNRVDYVHAVSNGGTRAAYLYALALAKRLGLSWLILLDHDTTLTPDYLIEVDERLAETSDPALGLLFPRIVGGGDMLSPAFISRWGTITPFDPTVTPRGRRPITALASGSVIRVDAMSAVGAIPTALWLDYLDHWLFREVQGLGYRAELMHATIHHELSIMDRTPPEPTRLLNVLKAERLFVSRLGFGARTVYPVRIALRAAKILPHDSRAAWVTLCQVVRPSRTSG